MKVCIVCAGNFPGGVENLSVYKSFVYDQAEELKKQGCKVSYFLIKGKGLKGYLINRKKLRSFIKANNFDIIHVHSGLSALLVAISTNKKFVVTFHGSDINNLPERILSILPILKSSWNIFVSKDLQNKALFNRKNKSSVIPCGVDSSLFRFIDKKKARKELGFNSEEKIVLFSSSFNNTVKNYPLAKAAIDKSKFNIKFVEILNKTREDVVLMLNAADLLLLTSFTEGSPQIIKEALATNCPIISVDVGDVVDRIVDVEKSYIIASRDKNEIAEKIDLCLSDNKRSNGRLKISNLENKTLVKKIINIYDKNI